MPSQPGALAHLPTGVMVATLDGHYGILTARRTVLGDHILVTQDGVWIPVAQDTPVVIDTDHLDGIGDPISTECPVGIPEMGCDMQPGCIGECGGRRGADVDVDVEIDDPDLVG